MGEEFLNVIKNKEKNINDRIFREYFNYESPSFLVRDLYEHNQNKTYINVKYLNESLIHLKNSISSQEIPKNENQEK